MGKYDIDSDDIPRVSATATVRIWLGVLKWGLVTIVVFGLFTLIMWQAGWWFAERNAENRARVNESSYGRQESLRTEVGKNIGVVFDLDTQIAQTGAQDIRDGLFAQRLNTVGMVCRDAAKIDDKSSLDPAQVDFIEANCVAGVVSPSSKYQLNNIDNH